MTAPEFIIYTKELIANSDKMLGQGFPEDLITRLNSNFLAQNKEIIEEQNPILWIIKNCSIKKFSVGCVYFIEHFVVDEFLIVGQAEANYIGIEISSEKIYMIGYEQIDEFLYGDGETPTLNNIYLLAQDSYKFLDALVERLKLEKLLIENRFNDFEEREEIGLPFKERAIELAGGNSYEVWRLF